VMLHSVAVGYQCFRGPCCLHLQGEVTGNGKKDTYTGMKCKRAADATSQQEVGRE